MRPRCLRCGAGAEWITGGGRGSAQPADAPPPPDVIRRGHEAWDEIGGILRVVLSGFQIGYDEKCAAEALAEARAAMYRLKEE